MLKKASYVKMIMVSQAKIKQMKKALQTVLAGLQLLIFVCVANSEFLNILKFKLEVVIF